MSPGNEADERWSDVAYASNTEYFCTHSIFTASKKLCKLYKMGWSYMNYLSEHLIVILREKKLFLSFRKFYIDEGYCSMYFFHVFFA